MLPSLVNNGEVMRKDLVERWWINLYDEIEPGKEPPNKKAKLREYKREYRERPEVKARMREYMKAYRKRPEVKARKREYMKAYDQRPEVKARKREHYRIRQSKAKDKLN